MWRDEDETVAVEGAPREKMARALARRVRTRRVVVLALACVVVVGAWLDVDGAGEDVVEVEGKEEGGKGREFIEELEEWVKGAFGGGWERLVRLWYGRRENTYQIIRVNIP